MKILCSINIRVIILGVTLLTFKISHAQIGEWIADQIKSEIMSELNPILNYNSNRLGDFGEFIWDAVVEAYSENEMAEKMGQLSTVDIDKSALTTITRRYPGYNSYWTTYNQISPLLSSRGNSYFRNLSNLRLNDMAKRKIAYYASAYVDSISANMEISSLSSVLNQAALDTVASFDRQNLNDSILKDINSNRALVSLFNHHPEVIRVYFNTLSIPALRSNLRHLFYWGITADAHKSKLPKKKKIIDPRRLLFVENEKEIEIKNGSDVIAKLNDDKIDVVDINILNLQGRPLTTYSFASKLWITDEHGRVVKTVQVCNKYTKEKCKQKSQLKASDIKSLTEPDKKWKNAYYILPEFGGPEVLLNSYFYDPSKDNKAALKEMKNMQKAGMKKSESYSRVTSIFYGNSSKIPTSIYVNSVKLENYGITGANPDPTIPENKKFNSRMAVEKEYKTDIFKAALAHNGVSDIEPTAVKSVENKEEKPTKGTSTGTSSTISKSHNTYTLKGKIDGKYAVTMTISIKGSEVSGTYYYDKYKRPMKIDGELSSNGRMILTEYEDQKSTGEYDGSFDGKVFKGSFVSYNNYKELPFFFKVN